MNKRMQRTALGVWLLGAALLAGCGGGGGGGGGPAVVLELGLVPAKAVFALGEPVVLTVRMKNVSGSAVAVSPRFESVLRVVRFERNGTAWPGATSDALTESPFAQAQAADLRILAPGEELLAPLTTEFEGDDDGQALTFLGAGIEDVAALTVYSLGAVGDYQLELRYAYTGVVPPGIPVYVGETASATATFQIEP